MRKAISIIVIFRLLMPAAIWALEISSPVENQAFTAGDALSVVVKPSPNEQWIAVIYGINKMDYDSLTGSYKIEIKIPPSLLGPQILTVTGVDKNGNELEANRSILVKLPPDVVLRSIVVGTKFMGLRKLPPDNTFIDAENIETRQLGVAGIYSDGIQRYIVSSSAGTTYTSNDERVVTVDSEGKVTAHGVGKAKITVKNGKFSATVDVIVKPYVKSQ